MLYVSASLLTEKPCLQPGSVYCLPASYNGILFNIFIVAMPGSGEAASQTSASV